jgi:hypothetical protein
MRRLLAQLESRANCGAVALLEISEEQGKGAMECAWRALPRAVATLHRDLEGMDRVMEIQMTEDDDRFSSSVLCPPPGFYENSNPSRN